MTRICLERKLLASIIREGAWEGVLGDYEIVQKVADGLIFLHGASR
jgi:hypothetical protein